MFRIRIFCSRGSLTPVAVPNASPNVFFEEVTGGVEADSDPCFEGCGLGPSVETGAGVPGYRLFALIIKPLQCWYVRPGNKSSKSGCEERCESGDGGVIEAACDLDDEGHGGEVVVEVNDGVVGVDIAGGHADDDAGHAEA